jgi:hypothetical protein
MCTRDFDVTILEIYSTNVKNNTMARYSILYQLYHKMWGLDMIFSEYTAIIPHNTIVGQASGM